MLVGLHFVDHKASVRQRSVKMDQIELKDPRTSTSMVHVSQRGKTEALSLSSAESISLDIVLSCWVRALQCHKKLITFVAASNGDWLRQCRS